MSEKETKTEIKDTKPETSIIDDNVSLLQAKVVMLEKDCVEKDELIKELTKKLEQATDWIEGDKKKMLLAEIKPKVDIPDEILMQMSIDKLVEMKKTLDVARIPAFKAGTPIYHDKKPSARAELDSTFEKNMAKLKGGN